TSDVGLIYVGEHEYLVSGYSDSDYVADLDARRSLTGYVFTIGNSVVSWKATLQPSVALCTIEAEYMALTEATKEGIWLKGLIEDLGFPQDQATVFCDNGLLDNHKVSNLEFCGHCVIGKQKRASFSKAIHQRKGTLNYLYADCWGPSRVLSLGGKLDPGGEKGIFIGYGDEVKGYRIWSPSGRSGILSGDLTFDEDYLFRVKQDPIESKLEDSVSEKVEDVPKQVEHVVPRDTDNDVTSPDDQPNLPHLDHEQD
nr:retrovirus-related Pol polyprotein from transposon TNT 1-94 [Tanacetum cinerariifolium]